jgi:outer membrane protein OmpA-like peptidoglycan-associated protein
MICDANLTQKWCASDQINLVSFTLNWGARDVVNTAKLFQLSLAALNRLEYQYVKTFLSFLLAVFITFSGIPSFAQKDKKKFKKADAIQLKDSVVSYSQSDIFAFPNVNKINEYTDAGKLKKIHRLDLAKQDRQLYTALREYVSNFGIDNFSRNTPMIWRLAQLSKKYGQPGEAILLYKLAIKHHQQGINIDDIYAQYDSIELDKKKYYVPLDYYYELVNYRKEIDTLRPPHAVLQSMGDEINSPKDDYGPTIGNVDFVLLFTSKRNVNKDGKNDEDLFYSIKVDGVWTQAEEFKTINTSYNEGSACLSLDGKHLYFSRCNAPGSIGDCDLYLATLQKDSTWGEIKNLGPEINSTSWDSQPSISHKGDTLFFASSRLGGFGLTDIYYSVKDKQGKWQKAKNAGPIINTRNYEVSPFFHHKFNVLYFSSNGHALSFGEFDIYKSYLTNKGWGEPKNIGPLVNGAGSEQYFTIDSKSADLYYAHSAQDEPKNLDLFSFPVPMEAQPEATAHLKGSLKNESGKPLTGIVSVIDLEAGIEVAPKFLREDGTFDFSLINNRKYLLIIQGDDFFRIEETFFMKEDLEINRISEPLETKIAFQSLAFENSKSEILPEMRDDLGKLANFLIDHPKQKLRISGHTDSQGNEETNKTLSQSRADAIREYLITNFNIDGSRITATGFGSSKPIVEETSEENKKLNRRVEFEIYRD